MPVKNSITHLSHTTGKIYLWLALYFHMYQYPSLCTILKPKFNQFVCYTAMASTGRCQGC